MKREGREAANDRGAHARPRAAKTPEAYRCCGLTLRGTLTRANSLVVDTRSTLLFHQYKRVSTKDYGDGREDNSRCKLRDLFYSWCGLLLAWRRGQRRLLGTCVDNCGSCGVVLNLSNRFFGALAGTRFLFGFRPRLLGIGKELVGTDQVGRE